MTTAARIRLVALGLLLTSCSRGYDPAPPEYAEVKTIVYRDGSSILVERFVFDDGVTCYRYFNTGSNGWSCIRVEP